MVSQLGSAPEDDQDGLVTVASAFGRLDISPIIYIMSM
jgi:hypothetical protein